MKARESGMPDEATWASFFDPPVVLDKLALSPGCQLVVEFGCGYGTFTIPAAKQVQGTLFALDIDPAMIDLTRERAETAGLKNVRLEVRDFMVEGTGLPDDSVDYAMLFNILHAESL
jgi:ubiquinone/menaquinone biosynthesis C-methylase UbiE